MSFVELTLGNGQPLDLPASSLIYLESLNEEEKAKQPGCKSGLFFDLGNGPQASLVAEPYPKLKKKLPAESGPWVHLDTGTMRVSVRAAAIVALRGIEQEGDGPACQLTHRLGERLITIEVKETRDALRAALAPIPQGLIVLHEEEKTDGNEAQD